MAHERKEENGRNSNPNARSDTTCASAVPRRTRAAGNWRSHPGQPPIPGEDDPFGFPDPPQIPEIGDPIQASGGSAMDAGLPARFE